MTLHSLLVLSDGVVVFSYYFGKAPLDIQDSFEAQLSTLLQAEQLSKDSDWCTACAGKPVVARLHQNFAFILAGSEDTDELSLSETLPFLIQLVVATCDGRLTSAQLLSFQGKVTVCLHEACPQGDVRCTDVPTVLRNAKLKAAAV